MSILKKLYFFKHPKLRDAKRSLDSICCVCFSRDKLLNLSRYKWNDATLSEIITYCLPLQEFSDEWSPPNICRVCAGDLLHTYTFLSKASTAYLILKSEILETKDYSVKSELEEDESEELDESAGESEDGSLENLDFKPIKEEDSILLEEENCKVPKDEDVDETCTNKKPYGFKKVMLEIFNKEAGISDEEESHGSPQIFDEYLSEEKVTTEEGEEVYVVYEKEEPYVLNGEMIQIVKEDSADEDSQIIIEEEEALEVQQMEEECVEISDSDSFESSSYFRKEHTCETCNLKFEGAKAFMQHLHRKHPEDTRSMCEECGKVCLTYIGMKIHKSVHRRKKSLTIYGENANNTDGMRPHEMQLSEAESKRYPCKTCGKSFKKKSALKDHALTHTKEKPYTCNTCGVGFSLRCNLMRHNMLHEGIKPFLCDICGKRFIQKTTLIFHQKNYHGNFKKRKCRYCLLEFDDPEDLTKHLEENHQVDNLVSKLKLSNQDPTCSTCGKKFPCRSLLAEHITIHTGVKNFECHVCKKRFRLGLHLKRHMLVHTEERPHQCRECGMRFRQKGHLMYHMAMHEGVKKYVCPFCNKAFTLKGNLTVHVRIHTGITPYVCKICDRRYNDSNGLKRHMKSRHDT